jgi:hypothetical protein
MAREMGLLSALTGRTRLNILIANTKGETAGPKAKEKLKQQRKQAQVSAHLKAAGDNDSSLSS